MASLADALRACSSSHRVDVGRQLRRLRAAGTVLLRTIDSSRIEDVGVDFHDRLRPAYSAYWRMRSEGCMLDRPGIGEFVERVVSEGVRDGWAQYSILTVNGSPIAWHIGLRSQNALYWWIPAHSAEWRTYSPGKLLLALAIEQAIADRVTALHFLTGAQSYKMQWRPTIGERFAIRWHAPTVKGGALAWYDGRRQSAKTL
jgi:CelD/BcsL family acetyltransferase involved in cellulose biosynthesis